MNTEIKSAEWLDENQGDNKKLLNFCHWVGNKGYKINGYDDSQLNKIIELFLSEYTTDVVNVGKVTTDGVWEKNKVYLSPLDDKCMIYINGQWEMFYNKTALNEIITQIEDKHIFKK